MVRILIKRETECFFMYDTHTSIKVHDLINELVVIYNGIFKVLQLSTEVEALARHGVCISSTDLDNVKTGEFDSSNISVKFLPEGGFIECTDPSNVRCGRAPTEDMAEILHKTVGEARARVSKNQVESGICLNQSMLKETFQILVGAISIVYPNGLPTCDPIQEDLRKIQDNPEYFLANIVTEESIKVCDAEFWWAGKKLELDKELANYTGKNEKTKITAKLQKKGSGPPAREPSMTTEEMNQMMLLQFKRQQELKKLEEDDDNGYLDSEWADNHHLKKSFQGLKNVKWK